ncbi:expressed unknown protein [Ectocarpus siliculosus]|uniref:Uncharacterized protein n=1 Tax=Ectocarpus siliculosus TaxID=2880 RepID=D8LFY7_ECTSI|nr:expressed unknown protein [Ectocarpus siliculosus]|eukprot:CBN78886.1 expressed unknown protein [Ectocarpus siliculosus]
MLSGQGAKAAASARLVAAFLPRMCTDGVCPAWRPGGTVDLHNVVMARCVVGLPDVDVALLDRRFPTILGVS